MYICKYCTGTQDNCKGEGTGGKANPSFLSEVEAFALVYFPCLFPPTFPAVESVKAAKKEKKKARAAGFPSPRPPEEVSLHLGPQRQREISLGVTVAEGVHVSHIFYN